MKFNPVAGGSKSGFLKAVGTCQRDIEIGILVKELETPVTTVAKTYGFSRVRVYQILKRDHTVLNNPDSFWSWIVHSKTVKTDYPEEWELFRHHWCGKDQPDKPDWLGQ